MQTPEQLRAEAARCIQAAKSATERGAKLRLSARAFQLAQEAEVLVRAAENPLEPAVNGRNPAGLAQRIGALRQDMDRYRRFLPTELDGPIIRDLTRLLASAGRGLAQFVAIRTRRWFVRPRL